MSVQAERDLRRSVLDSVRRELAHPVQFEEQLVLERGPGVERLELAPELLPELERMAGPASYDRSVFPMDRDLLGRAQRMVPITMEQSIRSAVQNNLALQFARLSPAISEAQVVQAQAAFDWTFFTNVDLATTEPPGAAPRDLVNTQLGLRRGLPSGGLVTFQQDLNYTETGGTIPSDARDVAWTFRFDQPLLRNFGSDVNMAQVRLARNQERESIANVKRELLRIALETERAYWQLVQAHYDVLILQRLYERGVVTRDIVILRAFEATPAQVADARARVERRQADVLRAQNTLRTASDNLKALINHQDVTVGDETMLIPVDLPVDQPISYNLADTLLMAFRNRPEIRQAILSIDNTSIRQLVADNARLPRLDLRLQARLAGQDPDNWGDAFGEVFDRDFVDFLVGFAFEQPIGNRGPEAQLRQRRIERMQATIAYRNTVQQVALEVKRALRLLVTNYRLIEQTRVTRYAESENLRSFLVERQLVAGFTIQLLDLEFRRQESLALAEREEIAALVDYNLAVAQLYTAMGTALEHNRIVFDVPDADDPLAEGGLHTRHNRIVPAPHRTPYMAPRDPAPFWRRSEEP